MEINACACRSCYRSERMVHTKISRCRCKVGIRWYPRLGMHSYSTTIHCKIFCHLHHLSYYVVMLRYILRILFSSLCCAVIDFVAGIVHGVLLIYSDFGLVIYHTLIQFLVTIDIGSTAHWYSPILFFISQTLLSNSNFRDENRCCHPCQKVNHQDFR